MCRAQRDTNSVARRLVESPILDGHSGSLGAPAPDPRCFTIGSQKQKPVPFAPLLECRYAALIGSCAVREPYVLADYDAGVKPNPASDRGLTDSITQKKRRRRLLRVGMRNWQTCTQCRRDANAEYPARNAKVNHIMVTGGGSNE